MRVLYSTQSVVEFDGQHYYSNPIQATYRRYLTLGEDITVLCYLKNVTKASSDRVDDNALKYTFVRKVNTFKELLNRVAYKKEDVVIRRLVENSDYCVAHVPCAHSYKVIKYAKLFRKPYLTVVCGCPWDSLWNYDWRGKLLAPKAFFRLRLIQKHAPFSIYVTNQFLQKRYPNQGESIGCSNVNISTNDIKVLNQRINKINNCFSPSSPLKIGTAAALDVPYKGQEYVIKALSRLKRKGYLFEYHLIGIGNPQRLKAISIKEGVSDIVFFHGAIPQSEVFSFLDKMDIYIQPSKQEGLPRALIEAMSRGCLCLGSKVAGIPELLDSNYIFTKGSVNGIVELLSKITKDDLLLQSKRNFNKAIEYDHNILNQRRSAFLELFKNSILPSNSKLY